MKTMYRHLLMRDEAGAVHRPIQDLAGARPWREGARQQHHPTPHVASWRFDEKKISKAKRWRVLRLLRCGAVHAQGRFLRPSSGERRVVHSAHYTAAGRSVSAIPSPFPSTSTPTQNTATRADHSPVPVRPRPRLTPAGCQFELFAALTRVDGYLHALWSCDFPAIAEHDEHGSPTFRPSDCGATPLVQCCASASQRTSCVALTRRADSTTTWSTLATINSTLSWERA